MHLRRVGRYLRGRHTVRDLAYLYDQSYGTAHERLQRGLAIASTLPIAPLRWWKGHCVIMVADALWTRVNGKRVTVYIILLRGTDATHACTTVALPLLGQESETGWHTALRCIPEDVRQEIIGVTIDGHAGLQAAVEQLCGVPDGRPVIQWCQFHCLAELLRKLGKKAVRKHLHARRCWALARATLDEHRQYQREVWTKLIVLVMRDRTCPTSVRRYNRKSWTLSG